MTTRPEASRCSGGVPVEFVWAGDSSPSSQDDIEAAVDAFTRVITGPATRVWDPRHLAITKGEFRSRIIRGQAGRLQPVTGVKEIGRGDRQYVYEIVYDFNVVDVIDGKRVVSKARVRLYIAEPPEAPGAFIGLHLHEKEIDKTDHARENALQNIQIDKAIDIYNIGMPTNWGIQITNN